MQHRSIHILTVLAGLALAPSAHAFDGIVEKKVFTIPRFTTVGGRTIKDVRIGYETYGTLNAAGTNAIFVAHYFSGISHAAGRYEAGDAAPGYWDSIIGAGKPFDTDRYFVVSADSLVNLSTKDPNVVTTGPASIDPDTGKPYGMRFPIVTIKDFVMTQKALADSPWSNLYKGSDALDRAGAARASSVDANSFLYLVRANQLYRVG